MKKRIEVVWDLPLYPSEGQWFGENEGLNLSFSAFNIYCRIVKASPFTVFFSSVEWDITGIVLELDVLSISTTCVFKESTMISKIPLISMHIICFFKGNLKANSMFFWTSLRASQSS